MKTSIVLATYNGSKYILEQLNSIMNQTLNPNEVLIFDDNSTDNTIKIIQDFIESNSLDNWNLYINEHRKGWKKNFWDGLKVAQHELIFLCDQDDIWLDNKIEKMVSCFKNNNKIQLLASGYIPFYEDDRTKKVAKRIQVTLVTSFEVKKVNFDRFFNIVIRPGCTYCFKNSLLKNADAIWCDDFAHDSTLWSIANLLGGLYILEDNLIYYRRHEESATSPLRYTLNAPAKLLSDSARLYNENLDSLHRSVKLLVNLKQYITMANEHNCHIAIISKLIDFNELRLNLLCNKNPFIWLLLQLKYFGYYFTLKNNLRDLYLVFCKILSSRRMKII